MKPTFHHTEGSHITGRYDGVELFEYRYRGDGERREGRRPLFHPVRSLSGNVVTASRPWDHRWHRGLSMTCAELSGCNFWGGPTYVRDKGYVELENHGEQRHEAWIETAPPCRLRERITWLSATGEPWIDETRRIEVVEVSAAAGRWTMLLSFTFVNIADIVIEFGSPTTNGRPMAGYGGLFWRAPRDFHSGKVISVEGEVGEAAMGKRSPFLGFVGRHDEVDAASTVLFVDLPSNPRHPTQWFVRNGIDPYVSASFMFDQVFPLAPGDRATFSYLFSICDGELGAGAVAELADDLTGRFGVPSEA